MSWIIGASSEIESFQKWGGGKATNLARLCRLGIPVPEWFCVSSAAFREFVQVNSLAGSLSMIGKASGFSSHVEQLFLGAALPPGLESDLALELEKTKFLDTFLAVRSSGMDEDSKENSFAGLFSSYLFQKGLGAVVLAMKKCWASAFSERAVRYRLERGLSLSGVEMGVVIQKMVDADVSGVAFSKDPTHPTRRGTLMISSVWGLGEGLVSGELDADHFVYDRDSKQFETSVAEKTHAFQRADSGGLKKTEVPEALRKQASLSKEQLIEVAQLALSLEEGLGSPQDCEWAFEGQKLQCLQTRPITNLPSDSFFDPAVNGRQAVLWDNSNIIESYNGVTLPLTFSFASGAYRQVYIQFCEILGISQEVIRAHESMFRNMLGILRGRIYYNLINWYRLVLMLPGASNNKAFMETMMGVKQQAGQLNPEVTKLFEFIHGCPRHSFPKNLFTTAVTIWRFARIDGIVSVFHAHFDSVYEEARRKDFSKVPLPGLIGIYQDLEEKILRRWHAPIINDYLCMVFFGLLKRLTEEWVKGGESAASLQNDLLCGQGNLESTEPTKMLMRIAEKIDLGDEAFRRWFTTEKPSRVWSGISSGGKPPEIHAMLLQFLDRYGFRCVDELKLEEPDLHDDPSFVIGAIASYVRMKAYSIRAMEDKEAAIQSNAEAIVKRGVSGFKRLVYFWVLRQARKAVRNRENLRFARTKIFGVVRHLFRAVGGQFVKLGILGDPQDVFYLTVDEIVSFVEGRSVSLRLSEIVSIRKAEYGKFAKTPAPPDRLLTCGAVGVSCSYPQLLADSDLLRDEVQASTDPNVLKGTPCCPGVVEGVVRVVKDLNDAEGMNGEILVTSRTDPGWVPLYPSCSGLLIERGSLLSHSAVVARELGLPTIVGISGGLMTKLKTGQKVRIDAGKGEVRILS